MMVTMASNESFLGQLISGSNNKNNKAQIYNTLTDQLRDEETAGQICEEIGHQSTEFTTKICEDIQSSNSDIAVAAVQTLGVCLHSDAVLLAFSEADCLQALITIRKAINDTTDKTLCTRGLWCLASKAMTGSLLKNEVRSILEVIECVYFQKKFQSMLVEHEGLNVIIRLLVEVPDEMSVFTSRWAKLVYPMLLHDATRVRERAVTAMDLGMSWILKKPEDVSKTLMWDLKSKDKKQSILLEQMTKLMESKQEMFVMRVWEYYVRILGKLLHHGQLINQLLPFVEQAFKNPSPTVKCAAYHAWTTLIDNFSLNLDILADGKRVKLIMQVFKLSNAKVESVAMEKLQSWWFFVRKLGEKAPIYFDSVVVPLLNFCIGGISPKSLAAKGQTPTMARLGIISSPGTPSTPGSPSVQFKKLQLSGAHVLGRILGPPLEDPSIPRAEFLVDASEHNLIPGPAMFVKHFNVLIPAVRESVCNLQTDLPDGLLYHIWYSLVAHVKNVLENVNKKDASEVLTSFLTNLQHLIVSQALPPEKLLKLLQAVLCLPRNALSSSSYAIGTSQTGMMQGTPVLFLLDLLFNHRLLETSSSQELFFVLFGKLVACGMTNTAGALDFMKVVLQHVDQAAPKMDERESIWRLWSLMVNPLLEHIIKTNEVNAGDALEHDFSCMYTALQLPLQHFLSSHFTPQSLRSMMQTWTELYNTFSRLAALVTNAEANICCEELCCRIAVMLDNNPDKLKDVTCIETVAEICKIVVDQIDFSGIKSTGQFSSSGLLSPGKFMSKKKVRPLGNLHSLIKLVVMTAEALHLSSDDYENLNGVQVAATSIIGVLTALFTHIPLSGIVAMTVEKLAPVTGSFYQGSAKKPTPKIYSQSIMGKLEKLWLDIVTCIQARYQGQFDSEFLKHLSPLLEATFHHPRRAIKNQTSVLWNSTFAHSAPLTYPESLKSVLAKVKEKTPISLPGWEPVEVNIADETQLSQMSQGAESQVPLPNIAGLPSSGKAVGSFMNKVASPEVKKSPLKRGKSPSVTPSARKKLGLNDMSSRDFVVIAPTTRRTRVLTQHQKEVLHERKALPAMYNNLDASQDRSIISQGSATQDSASVDASQTPFDFTAAIAVSTATDAKKVEETKQIENDPKPTEKVDEKPDKPEKSAKGKRRSVTFAPSPAKAKQGSASAKEAEEADAEEKHSEPKTLLGHKVNVIEQSEVRTDPEMAEDAVVIPDTECSEPPTKEAMHAEKTNAPDSDDNQDSEMILKQKPEKEMGRKSKSAGDNEVNKVPKKQQPKQKAAGVKTIDLWLNASPKKRHAVPTTVLVEETQQDSDTPAEAVPSELPNTAVVGETPPKEDTASVATQPEEVQDIAKQLFTDDSITFVPDSEMVSETPAAVTGIQGFVPEAQKADGLLGLKPVVIIPRLSNKDIKQLSPKKEPHTVEEGAVGTEEKVMEKEERSVTVVRKIRRRSSIKYSKASQEKQMPISPPSMDDIIPSSQDAFGLPQEPQQEPTAEDSERAVVDSAAENNSIFIVSQSEEQKNDEPMEVDMEETAPSQTSGGATPVIVDLKSESSDGGNAIQNPDIIPAELSSAAETQDSQATIVKHKRGRKKKVKEAVVEDLTNAQSVDSMSSVSMLDDTPESMLDSTPQRARSTRRRSMPSKFKEADVYKDKGKHKKRDEYNIIIRPAETMASSLQDESQQSKLIEPDLESVRQKESQANQGEQSEEQKLVPTSVKPVEEEPKSHKKKRGRPARVKRVTEAKKAEESETKQDKPIEMNPEREIGEVGSEADDDVPINLLVKQQSTKPAESPRKGEVSDDEADDVPLMFYCKNDNDGEQPEEEDIVDDQLLQDEVPMSNAQRASEDLLSVDDMFKPATLTSTPKEAKKVKRNRGNDLAIDMRTSPVNKKLRSKGNIKLNRSLNAVQKRRKSPSSPFAKRRRSKSVSPKNRLLRKVGKSSKEKVNDSQEQIDLMKGTELSSSEDQDEGVPKVIEKEASPQKTSLAKDASPRRSPRKQKLDYSPQKSALSPHRCSLSQSIELPETPTSATKHQSRASLILERSRLLAPRTTLYAKKKFTNLKPTGKDSGSDDGVSPGKSILKATKTKVNQEEANTIDESCDAKGSASPPPTRRSVSANSPSFRPVQIPRIYSPSASPSAGILKKRKLTGEIVGTDSPSPPNKQRRVSFNESIDVRTLQQGETKDAIRPVNRCLDMPAKAGFTTSPLVTSSKVTSNQSRFLTSTKNEAKETEKKAAAFAVPHPVNKRKEVEASQASVKSTVESQLNCEEPIFPKLQTCADPIDQILPQLTSSTWVRGLGQLIRSKNIRTVGDLCALTELEVNNLPIRTPKVATVKQVLESHASQLEVRQPKATTEQPIENNVEDMPNCDTATTPDSPLKTPLPSVEDALAMSPVREIDTSIDSMADVHLDLKTTESPPSSQESNKPDSALPCDKDVNDNSDKNDAPPATENNLEEQEFNIRDPLATLDSMPDSAAASYGEPVMENSTENTPEMPAAQLPESSESLKTKILKRQLLNDVEAMVQKLTPEKLSEMPPSHLVAIHMHLNTMMTNVITAQQNQCPLSPIYGESQE